MVGEMGKVSTSTLQRRLRLGYGRGARILDVDAARRDYQPADESQPREVVKRPELLGEVEDTLR